MPSPLPDEPGRCPEEGCNVRKGWHDFHTDMGRPEVKWPNPAHAEVIAAHLSSRKKPGNRKKELEDMVDGVPPEVSTDVPPEAVAAWEGTEKFWLDNAKGVLHRFLMTHPQPFTTAEDIWPLLPAPPEMRIMVQVVRWALTAGLMERIDSRPLKGVYRTQDGVEFAENKTVPLYVSKVGAVAS